MDAIEAHFARNNMVIWKYRVEASGEAIEIDMPGYQATLAAGLDSSNDLCIWCLVDPDQPKAPVRHYVVGTGWELEDIGLRDTVIEHVGSVNQLGFIWHVFREVE